MKLIRKISAGICVIALVVSSIVYYPDNAKAVSYDSLTFTTLGSDISYSKLSDGIEGMSPTSPELLDAGQTLLFAFAATNENVTLSLNGVKVTVSDERVTELSNAIVKVNPQKLDDNAYTLITITSSKGTSEYVIKKGNPTSSGEVPTANPGESTSTGDQQPTQPGQTTQAPAQTTQTPVQTTSVPAASSIPKKLIGLDAINKSGSDTIDNAMMFAWAGADDPANVDGYDPTVTSVALYIYKNGNLVTKIGNATKGGIVGGLSAGSYTAQAANVNAKGEGPKSDTVSFTVTGTTLDYAYPINCVGPKSPNGLSYITGNPEVPADNPAQADNKLGVAWAPSSEASIPSYDPSVTGYNLYLFDAETGKPYRRVYVDGASTSNIILESVSAGEYIACLSALNAAGEESALAATSFGMSSKVTVKGKKLDNGQSFDKPNQPTLPLGLAILTEGIQYGFTVAWSSDADFTGQRLNLFVDGVCIKCGINGTEASYYENRLAAGTYTVEIKAQYTSNNVESFGLSKTVTIAADPGISTKTPEELADPTYAQYVEETTQAQTIPSSTSGSTENPSDENTTTSNKVEESNATTSSVNGGNETQTTKGEIVTPKPTEKPTVKPTSTTTKAPVPSVTNKVVPTKAVKKPVKVTVKNVTKKKNSKRISVKFKKVSGATKYKIEVSSTKSFKKVLVRKTAKKVSVVLTSNRIKKAKKLYVRVKAVKVVSRVSVEGAWSKPKRVTVKK